jgi:hypothetical protein
LKPTHFSFAGRQIGVCHCGPNTTVYPHRDAGCSSSLGCGCLGSADLAFGGWRPSSRIVPFGRAMPAKV